ANLNLERTLETGASGDFAAAGLPVNGFYTIVAAKNGFLDGKLEDITLAAGVTANLTLKLDIPGGHTQITVTGVAGKVRADQPQLGLRLGTDKLQQPPLPGPRITALPLLNAANRPAINQGDIFMNQVLFTTNGSGRRQAWFEIDGSSASD